MEVNSTFYSPLPRTTLAKWAKITKGRDLLFAVKIPGSITHDSLIERTNQACNEMLRFKETHLDYLSAEGVLGPILFQMPPYFRAEHMDKLIQVISSFDHDKFTCFVEPRHPGLYANKEFRKEIGRIGAYVVAVDSPEMEIQNNMYTSSGKQYMRFHGRNREQWFKKGAGKLEKYDDLYSKDELETFARIISPLATTGDEIFIFFNNHP